VRREVRDVERLVERTRREVEAARLEQARADLGRAQEAIERIEPEPEPELPEPPPMPAGTAPAGPPRVEAGAVVWLRGVAAPGEALNEPDEQGEFDVQLGALHTRVRLEQVERAAPPDAIDRGVGVSAPAAPPYAPEEIEVRGERVDDALPKIDAFLDLAARAGRTRVRLIHGRGTGTLRRAVRELVARHPLVTSYEEAERAEGGDGVTIAHLQAN
jgi:DNA mismatch repair protein MutS2